MSGDDSAARFGDRAAAPGDAYALARWITGDRADAEDVVQEACLRALPPSVAMPAAAHGGS
jgi:RNA polymerase sigma-70 factor (ECF subfamily)